MNRSTLSLLVIAFFVVVFFVLHYLLRVCSNSCPLSHRCHPTVTSSVTLFSCCSQTFLASESTLCIRWSKYWSFSFSISPFNEYPEYWFPLGVSCVILHFKGSSRVFLGTTVGKCQFCSAQLFFMVQHWHPYMTTGKTKAFVTWTFAGKVIPLLFNIMSTFVKAFLPRSIF